MATFYEEALVALHAQHLDEAQTLFQRTVVAQQRAGEASFYLGVIAHIRKDNEATLAHFKEYVRIGVVSNDFYATLGSVVRALGQIGEETRAYLQYNRLLPNATAVKTVAGPRGLAVEPWHFSASKMNLHPRRMEEYQDLPKLIETYVLPGHLPEKPLFDRSSILLTVGSCFAEELNRYIAESGMTTGWVCVPPGLNNTFAVRQFFEWCITGEQSSDSYWYDEQDGGAIKWKPEVERDTYLANVKAAAGFVFTIGLAEVWEDTQTKTTFWRGIPKSIYDPARHVCRMSTVEENAANMRRLVDLVHSVAPNAQIIFTLSPVPLKATFEDRSCITADCVSKSTLRVAIEQVTRAGLPRVAYWPSFEIVRWLSGHLPFPMYGDDGNVRHVNRQAVKLILDAFMKHYYTAPPSP